MWRKPLQTSWLRPSRTSTVGAPKVGTSSRGVRQISLPSASFLAALKLADGSEIWRTPREDVPTFGAPTVDVREGRSQLVCNGFRHIGGYDLASGKELWKLEGGGDIPVPTPVI